MTVILKSVLSIVLSIVAFFGTFYDASQIIKEEPAPESAVHMQYSWGIREHMNLYMPEDLQKGQDVIVLLTLHPGTWFQHDEKWYDDACIEAAKEGYVAATIDWCQLQEGANLYHMLDDIDKAAAKIKEYLVDEGYNPKSMIIASHSSGAQLALSYAYSRYETAPIDIGFVVSNAAMTTFIDETDTNVKNNVISYALISVLLGEPVTPLNMNEVKAKVDSVTPVALVNPDVPPTILVHGDADTTTPYSNSENLYNLLQQAGVDSVLITYEGADHMLDCYNHEDFAQFTQQRTQAFNEFVDKYCR